MSRRRKLEKFADLLRFPNVLEMERFNSGMLIKDAYSTVEMKGKWREAVFKNDNPICIELACGRGEYALALAERYPQVNYIGVDIKGARIWKGAKYALENSIANLVFLRTRIEQMDLYFEEDEVDEIWITFPDPFPAKENRRMTGPRFLSLYKKIIKENGVIHLKTDDKDLYDYSFMVASKHPNVEITCANEDIYSSNLELADLDIQTHYERIHIENKKTIKYLLLHIIDRPLQH